MNSDDDIDSNSSGVSNNPTVVLRTESDISSSALFDGTYFKLLLEKCTDRNTVAVCVKCTDQQCKEVKGYGKTTSNFLGHLKRKHGAETLQECKKYMKLKKRKNDTFQTSRQSAKTTVVQDNFNRNLVNYFVNSMIPLRTVEDPYFVKMMVDLNVTNNGIEIPWRRSLKEQVTERSHYELCEIKEKLAAVKYLCATVEIWRGNKRNYFGVKVHWIDDDYRRQSAALACRRFKEPQTSDRLKDLLLQIFTDYNIDATKLVCSITDNGSSYVKAFEKLGVNRTSLLEYDSDNESINGSEESSREDHEETDNVLLQENIIPKQLQNSWLPLLFKCNTHTLNLIASEDVQGLLTDKSTSLGKMHSTVMEKCNDLWSAAARTRSAHNLEHTLIRPSLTRLNSYYDALKSVLQIKSSYSQLAAALGIRNPLRDSEFQYIEEYCKCSAPIATALDILLSHDSFYGTLLPCLHALKQKLQKMTTQNLIYCEPLAAKYLQSVEKRFEEFYTLSSMTSERACVAALCYPRFKNKWLACLTVSDQNKCINIFQTVVAKEISDISQCLTINNAVMSTRHQEDEFFDFISDSGVAAEVVDARKRADMMILNFFAEASQERELLQSYPVLGKLFMEYNTPMPSSQSVERMFSYETMLNIPSSQALLSDDLFEKRLVMKCNLNIKKSEIDEFYNLR